ncbi:hypothetical protein HHK36_023855 [Tetracentron sinense]|uniref:NADH dehydrogenase [ubiquinone] 1 alpha subcomplex subunit 12 n=1 Tax=Tetracentron sinense TaxID=13715 RepID=A0A835D923_TETSI|nr:hypothetical protein HHK36_023855 [Tetracentron sinense]
MATQSISTYQLCGAFLTELPIRKKNPPAILASHFCAIRKGKSCEGERGDEKTPSVQTLHVFYDTTDGTTGGTTGGTADDTTDGTTGSTTGGITDDTTGNTTGGTMDGTTGGTTGGTTDDTTGSTTGGTTDGTTGGTTDGTTDDTTGSTTGGTTDGTTGGTTDGTTDDTTGGTTDDTTGGTADDTTGGIMDDTMDDTTGGTTGDTMDGTMDGTADGTTGGTTDGTMDDTADDTVSGITGDTKGVDKVGNRYFARKEEVDGIIDFTISLFCFSSFGALVKEKRWVIFKGEEDPTSVPVEWICWLNGQRKRAPTPKELIELEARRERVKLNVALLKKEEEERKAKEGRIRQGVSTSKVGAPDLKSFIRQFPAASGKGDGHEEVPNMQNGMRNSKETEAGEVIPPEAKQQE